MSASLTTRETEARTTVRCLLPCVQWLSSHQRGNGGDRVGKGPSCKVGGNSHWSS